MSWPHSCKWRAQYASVWPSLVRYQMHFMNEKPDDHKSALKLFIHTEEH